MAIFEIGGGVDGIAEYLETGHKAGRNYMREEMDERVVLYGNLALTDTIIKNMDRGEGIERYLHLSFSFAEDQINDQMLYMIAKDCREFFGAAYEEDELNQYWEAHKPKLKAIQNQNGKLDKRYVHIHGAIPTINPKTGKRANPLEMLSNKFGSKNATWEYINAFQEHINAKYGLKSPKEAMGISNGKAKSIGRHKDVEADQKKSFLQQTKILPEIILGRVLSDDIRTVADFKAMISEYGEVSTGRKLGVPYFKVQIPGESKSVRLDDKWFQPEFIEKSLAEKKELLTKNPEYLEAGAPREPEQSDAALLQEWFDLRSKEVRYIHSGNKWAKEVYFKLSKEEKLQVLASMQRGEKAPEQEFEGTLIDIPVERFNRYKMRTLDEIQAAEEFGKEIIGNEDGAADNVIKTLTAMESVISKEKLEAYLLEHTAGMEQYDEALAAVLASPELVAMENEKGEICYTSETVLRIEERLMASVKACYSQPEGERIDTSNLNTSTLNKMQAVALTELCSGKGIVNIKGPAGSGKSFILALMNKAAVAQGYEVSAAILQGKTGEDFERDSGIKTNTIHSFLADYKSGKIKLHEKSILVVDEAGMVGSQQMQELVAVKEETGCRLRFVGDRFQVQSVAFGSALDKVASVVGETALVEIMRQKEKWQQDASVALSTHDVTTALAAYDKHGNVRFAGDQTEAIDELVKQVRLDRNNQIYSGLSTIVICKTNADRKELNYLIRQDLIDEGKVGKESVMTSTGENSKIAIAKGDVMMFLGRDKDLGVRNGTSGTVTDIQDGKVFMQVNGKEISFSQNYPVKMDHGYAVTINKSQGDTKDRAYVLASRNMTANDLYVALTRHRQSCLTYAGKDQFADLAEMSDKLSRSAQKSFSADHLEVGKANTMVDQLLEDHRSESLIARESKRLSMRELREMDPQRVIDTCAAKYGLDRELYSVTEEGKILCGSIQRDNVAFLTKEMHLDYKTEAVPALREMHSQMLKGIYVEQPKAPTQTQIYDFAIWRKQHETAYKTKLSGMNQAGREEQKRAGKNSAKVIDIKERLVKDRAALKAEYVKPQRDLFRQFRDEQQKKSAKPAVKQPVKGNEHGPKQRERTRTTGLSNNKSGAGTPVRGREKETPPPQHIRSEMRELQSMRKMDGVSQPGEVLLPDGVRAELGDRTSGTGTRLRRSGGDGKGLNDLQSMKSMQEKFSKPAEQPKPVAQPRPEPIPEPLPSQRGAQVANTPVPQPEEGKQQQVQR